MLLIAITVGMLSAACSSASYDDEVARMKGFLPEQVDGVALTADASAVRFVEGLSTTDSPAAFAGVDLESGAGIVFVTSPTDSTGLGEVVAAFGMEGEPDYDGTIDVGGAEFEVETYLDHGRSFTFAAGSLDDETQVLVGSVNASRTEFRLALDSVTDRGS